MADSPSETIGRRTMKNIALATALFAFFAAPLFAHAQAKTPPPDQAQPPAAAQQPAPAAPAAAAPAPAAQAQATPRATHRVPSTTDARACLEFQDNLQVIKCAEKYRWAS